MGHDIVHRSISGPIYLERNDRGVLENSSPWIGVSRLWWCYPGLYWTGKLILIEDPHFIHMTKLSGHWLHIFQIRTRHSGCRSQYLYTTKAAIKELYKLDTDDSVACKQRVQYLLEGDQFTCSLNGYEVKSLPLPTLIFVRRRLNLSNNTGRTLHLDSWPHRFQAWYICSFTLERKGKAR